MKLPRGIDGIKPRFAVRYVHPGLVAPLNRDLHACMVIDALLERDAMCERYEYKNESGYFSASSSMLVKDTMGVVARSTMYRKLAILSGLGWIETVTPVSSEKLFRLDLEALKRGATEDGKTTALLWREIESRRAAEPRPTRIRMPPKIIHIDKRKLVAEESSGAVYVMSNPLFNLIKVGHTTKSSEHRAKELSRPSGVPVDYVVEYSHKCERAPTVEGFAHDLLAKCRHGRTEFFSAGVQQAVDAIRKADEEVNGE